MGGAVGSCRGMGAAIARWQVLWGKVMADKLEILIQRLTRADKLRAY